MCWQTLPVLDVRQFSVRERPPLTVCMAGYHSFVYNWAFKEQKKYSLT